MGRAGRLCARGALLLIRSVPNLLAEATERARSEGSIRIGSALLQIAAQTAHIGGWTYDPRDNVAGWSDEVSAIHDGTPDGPRTLTARIMAPSDGGTSGTVGWPQSRHAVHAAVLDEPEIR